LAQVYVEALASCLPSWVSAQPFMSQSSRGRRNSRPEGLLAMTINFEQALPELSSGSRKGGSVQAKAAVARCMETAGALRDLLGSALQQKAVTEEVEDCCARLRLVLSERSLEPETNQYGETLQEDHRLMDLTKMLAAVEQVSRERGTFTKSVLKSTIRATQAKLEKAQREAHELMVIRDSLRRRLEQGSSETLQNARDESPVRRMGDPWSAHDDDSSSEEESHHWASRFGVELPTRADSQALLGGLASQGGHGPAVASAVAKLEEAVREEDRLREEVRSLDHKYQVESKGLRQVSEMLCKRRAEVDQLRVSCEEASSRVKMAKDAQQLVQNREAMLDMLKLQLQEAVHSARAVAAERQAIAARASQVEDECSVEIRKTESCQVETGIVAVSVQCVVAELQRTRAAIRAQGQSDASTNVIASQYNPQELADKLRADVVVNAKFGCDPAIAAATD